MGMNARGDFEIALPAGRSLDVQGTPPLHHSIPTFPSIFFVLEVRSPLQAAFSVHIHMP